MAAYIEANQPVSLTQVAFALGISRQSVYEQYQRGAVHVQSWGRSASGQSEALFALGAGRDVPRPRPYTLTERQKSYQSRHRAIIKARRPSKTMLKLGVWSGLAA